MAITCYLLIRTSQLVITKSKSEGEKVMSKLCKDQLVAKLVSLFQDADTDVDEAVSQAKSQLSVENKEAKREEYEKLFDAQLQTLQNRGCSEAILEKLKSLKGKVLKKVSETNIGEGNVPFLPVIPRTYRSIYDQMSAVCHKGKKGYTYLDPNAITDQEKASEHPYYILDVEDGEGTLNKTPEQAEKIHKKQSRHSLNTSEDVSLCTHTAVLSKYNVWATGSRVRSSGVPYVYLYDDRPRLDWHYASSRGSGWGSPSCGSRVGA